MAVRMEDQFCCLVEGLLTQHGIYTAVVSQAEPPFHQIQGSFHGFDHVHVIVPFVSQVFEPDGIQHLQCSAGLPAVVVGFLWREERM